MRGRLDLASDIPLLSDRQQVVDEPIKHQPGREEGKEHGEYNWQTHHDFGLHGIRWGRVEFLLDPHGDTHEQW